MNLKYLTDSSLITEIRAVAQEERRASAKLLYYLKEIEERRLFSDLGHGSLFEFMVKDLKFSEAAAGRRIRSARLLKNIPEIRQLIEHGKLNFTTISMAAILFKNEKISDIERQRVILKQIEGKSRLEAEKILNSHLKNPHPERHILVIGRETMLKIDKVTGLLGRFAQEEVISYAMDVTARELEKKKFAVVSRTRRSSGVSGRAVSASVKRAVYARDRVCTKCGSSFKLEFDHIKPFALGGDNSQENIRLLCRSCNQRNRITQFGSTQCNPSS